MTPANTVDYELIDLFSTTFEEPSVIFAVVVGLIFSITPLALTLSLLNICIFALIVVLV